MSTETESRDWFQAGQMVDGIPGDVQVMVADVASDYTPPSGWAKVAWANPDSRTWVAALGTQPLSETFALNLGRMSMAEARTIATMRERTEPGPASEAERLSATREAELVRSVIVQAVSTLGRPDLVLPTIGQGLRSVAQLIAALHKATVPQFHLELGVRPDSCPVCLEEDSQRRRDRLYPGRLDQVEAELAADLARNIPRLELLEILVEVDRTEERRVGLDLPDDPYDVAVSVMNRMDRVSLADVARVVRALRRVRALEAE